MPGKGEGREGEGGRREGEGEKGIKVRTPPSSNSCLRP